MTSRAQAGPGDPGRAAGAGTRSHGPQVGQIAHQWGHRPSEGNGCTTWFEVRAGGPPQDQEVHTASG
jgi:hypothetical protein